MGISRIGRFLEAIAALSKRRLREGLMLSRGRCFGRGIRILFWSRVGGCESGVRVAGVHACVSGGRRGRVGGVGLKKGNGTEIPDASNIDH